MISEKNCKQDIHLTLQNHAGSVEHYYHFLLGFLLPLALWENECRGRSSKKVYIRSCGIMDNHLFDIGLDGIKIIDKVLHETIRLKKDLAGEFSFIERMGYDDPRHYNFSEISAASLVLTEILSEVIAVYLEEVNSRKAEHHPLIVMIDRSSPDSFYLSSSCEIQGAGTSRRSIPNYDDLFLSTCSKYKNVTSVTLERKSLAFQIALFKSADIIVAQHGAALANLVWCRPNTTLIEIHPSDLSETVKNRDYFLNLASCMNLNYRRLDQDECHSNVDPDSLLLILRAVIDE